MAQRKFNPSYTPSQATPVVVSDGEGGVDIPPTPGYTTAPVSDIPVTRLALDLNIMAIATPQTPSHHTSRRQAPPSRVTLSELQDAHTRNPPTKPAAQKYYAIAQGKSVAIIFGWEHAQPFVGKYRSKCFFYSWDTFDEAAEFLKAAYQEGKAFPILAGKWD